MKRNNPDMSARRGPFRDDWSKAAKYIQQNMLLFCIAVAVKYLDC